MDNVSIAILVIFFEKAEQTIECLKSFKEKNLPIYLLDNGSSNDSRILLNDYVSNHKNIKIFREETNVGVGPGRNILISNANEAWLFFVDNDIVVDSNDWLVRLHQHIQDHPDIEVFIPRLFNLHEQQWVVQSNFKISGQKVSREPQAVGKINSFPGGAAVVKKTLFSRLGLYDENMFVGGEDYELSLRGILKGQPINGLSIEDIVLIHDHRPAKKAEDVSAALIRYDDAANEKSFNVIVEKHGILLGQGWRVWTERQRCQMGVEKSWYIKTKYVLRKKIRTILGRLRGA